MASVEKTRYFSDEQFTFSKIKYGFPQEMMKGCKLE